MALHWPDNPPNVTLQWPDNLPRWHCNDLIIPPRWHWNDLLIPQSGIAVTWTYPWRGHCSDLKIPLKMHYNDLVITLKRSYTDLITNLLKTRCTDLIIPLKSHPLWGWSVHSDQWWPQLMPSLLPCHQPSPQKQASHQVHLPADWQPPLLASAQPVWPHAVNIKHKLSFSMSGRQECKRSKLVKPKMA